MSLGRPLLRRAFLRHLWRHPWQMATTALGVALAVAVVVGIDLANASAERAFRMSVEGVAGTATHEVIGGPAGLDDSIYGVLRRSGTPETRRAAPVLEGRGRVHGRTVTLFGVDPFADGQLRSFTRGLGIGRGGDLQAFLTRPGAVVLATDLATDLGLGLEDSFTFEGPDGPQTLTVAGLLETDPGDDAGRQALSDLLVADIATAQEVLGRLGRLDRIDLRLGGDDGSSGDPSAAEARIAELLPAGAELRSKAARTGALDQMTRAFRLNLTALSMLALVVGMFLIYNAMTFSVVQRRPLLGRLRAMGVSRREIFALVLGEAAVLGTLATAVGVALGLALGHGLLALVVRTINDLYFALEARSVTVGWQSLAKGIALGVGGAMLAAAAPAREATSTPPRTTLRRSDFETSARTALLPRALAGLALATAAAALLAAPSRSLLLAFTGVFVFVLAFACWVPPAVMMGSRLAAPPMGRAFGVLGAMAARGLAASLSRTGVATGALVIAVATTLGVGVMVDSFRATLVDWLDVTLQADVYVTSARPSSRGSAPALEPEVVDAMKTASGVSFASTYRRTEVSSPVGPTQLHALSLDRRGFDAFQLERGDPDDLYRRFRDGDGVMVSEPYAYRHDLRRGDTVTLGADSGSQGFEVLGVFYDYASDRGLVMIDRALYDRHWRDDGVHSLGLFLEPGEDFDARVAELRASVDPSEVAVMPNRELRRISLDIFDRTFVITGVLRLLAIGVAFVGVLSALLALQLERARELGVLRATGLTPAQVWGLVTAQTGLLGLISGLLSTPLGLALAALLIHVINKRSFGWTLSMQVSPWLVVQAVVLALVAALLAGLYPSWRMSRSSPAWALREE